MRSAVVIARQEAEKKESDAPTDSEDLQNVRVETEGAIFDGGKTYLKGNPLHTTKDIICPDCRLPRLLHPVSGVGARPLPNSDQQYCQRQPPVVKQGYDVHGNLFTRENKTNSKKKKQPIPNTPVSSPPATSDGSSKPAATFPTVKCPNCPRYFGVTRVAQHLDRCLGFSSRGNRNKPPPENNTTPSNSAGSKRPLPSGEDEGTPVVTKKKKLGAPKKGASQKPSYPSKLKNGSTADVKATEDAGGGDGDAKS